MYECLSETELAPPLPERIFSPNFFVDISEYIDLKIDIMRIYESEIKKHPFPRSEETIRALALFRGAQCAAQYAESFAMLRGIWK
jgi:LmbE family N-acetylglucosaminyl deacetylase